MDDITIKDITARDIKIAGASASVLTGLSAFIIQVIPLLILCFAFYFAFSILAIKS